MSKPRRDPRVAAHSQLLSTITRLSVADLELLAEVARRLAAGRKIALVRITDEPAGADA